MKVRHDLSPKAAILWASSGQPKMAWVVAFRRTAFRVTLSMDTLDTKLIHARVVSRDANVSEITSVRIIPIVQSLLKGQLGTVIAEDLGRRLQRGEMSAFE
jgi:hypothetical protein